MKTVLQELIEDLNREIDNCERNGIQYRGIYLDARWKAENLLEKEKEQIIDAVNNGTFKKGTQYYQETFGDNPEAGI